MQPTTLAVFTSLAVFAPAAVRATSTPHQVLSCRAPLVARPSGRVNAGGLGRAVQLAPRRGLYLRSKIRDRFDYGTDELVAVLHFAADRMRRPDAPIVVGDLSRRHGGPFGRHVSHQNGRDVDLGLYTRGRRLTTFRRQTPRSFDAALNWRLVEALLASGWVERIFIDRTLHAPLRNAARRAGWSAARVSRAFALIRHEPGHTDHLHLRIRARRHACGASRRAVVRRDLPRRRLVSPNHLRRPSGRLETMIQRRLALSARLRQLTER